MRFAVAAHAQRGRLIFACYAILITMLSAYTRKVLEPQHQRLLKQ